MFINFNTFLFATKIFFLIKWSFLDENFGFTNMLKVPPKDPKGELYHLLRS